jgi:mRNA interferase RelE/StbE
VSYRLDYTDDARRDIRRLPGNVRQRARRMIAELAGDPRPAGARELRERPGRYCIRLDDWRIIYRVYNDDLVVLVLRVKRKRGVETYQNIE